MTLNCAFSAATGWPLSGPNGVGKTTLLKMLLGQIQPDKGSVQLGTNLQVAVFDQTRAQLDPNASLWENLTGDPLMAVSGASDQVMVRGNPKHVVAYRRISCSTNGRPERRSNPCPGARRLVSCWPN